MPRQSGGDEEQNIRLLQELCSQAEKLQKAAAELCEQLTARIEESRARRRAPERRRRARPRKSYTNK